MEKNEWKEIGEVINYLILNGGKAENSNGSMLEFDYRTASFILTNKQGVSEVAKLAGEVLINNWRIT